ncbi:MAG: molecular chaperone TorD family protein [Chloroflexi bacterium]|nr:molecular chaperone TorD family protein [Chloroflexota bacterium]
MSVESQDALGRSALYELVSLAFLYPVPGALDLLKDGACRVGEVALEMAPPELMHVVKQLADDLEAVDEQTLEQEYVSVFGHSIASDCSLYEAEYANAEVFQKSGSLADLNGFYAAFGVKPNPELKDRLDHIGVELEFMQLLTIKEAYAHLNGHGSDKAAVCRQAQANFLANHLAHWVKTLARRLSQKTGGRGIYSSLGQLIDLQIDWEMNILGLEMPPVSLASTTEPEEVDDECGTPPPHA